MARPTNRRMRAIRSLARRKCRERHGETLVEGVRAVVAALDAGADVREVFVSEQGVREGRFERLVPRFDALCDRVHRVPEAAIESISTVETSPGVLAVVGIRSAPASVLARMQRVVMLDGWGDPGNAGVLVRTAAWFGVEAVVTVPGTVDLYNPKAVRASMGGLWDVAHVEATDPGALLDALSGQRFAVYAADLSGVDVGTWKPVDPSVLVLGSEPHGLSEVVRQRVDARVLIPGRPRRGGAESLNAAVAAGILMHAWVGSA